MEAMYEPALCPECGRGCLLSTAYCMVVVCEGGRAGTVYGRPDVLFLNNDQCVSCNNSTCAWSGRAEDLYKRTDDSA